MDKKNEGLADNLDGDIILNESGTSLTYEKGEAEQQPSTASEKNDSKTQPEEKDPESAHS